MPAYACRLCLRILESKRNLFVVKEADYILRSKLIYVMDIAALGLHDMLTLGPFPLTQN